MITTGFDARVKVQQVIDNQLPEFLLSENPKAVDFLKQYYTSQEFRGGTIDVVENLDQYLSLNNLTPDILNDHSTISGDITSSDTTINVDTTNGFPRQYGLFKLNDEIISYTGITTNSFTGCIRGFSGITSYRDNINPEELVFTSSSSSSHSSGTQIKNLSNLFLREFYRKLKYLLAPGFEDVSFTSELDVNNFVKQARNFYQTKGTEESFRILFAVLYNEIPKVVNLEDYLLKPSFAEYIRRRVLVTEVISGDPNKLVGQMISNFTDTATGPVSEVEILTRNKKTFYKLQLFSGYNEKSLIEGTFNITPNSLVSDSVSIGSSVITVDSTIGFDSSGTLTIDNTNIEYENKSVNQFFGCSGVTSTIDPGALVYSNTDTIYGYEDGDTTKRVVLRITGVMSDIENKDTYNLLFENDLVSVKNLGESIRNNNENYKQFAFNTWIYNTRTRYEIESFSNNTVTLFETPDKSSLKLGDTVDILDRNAENIVLSNAEVTSIVDNEVQLNQSLTVASNRDLSIRKRFEYANSTAVQLESDKILSNVQNTYNEKDESMYVASNSLPDYTITKEISEVSVDITPSTNLDSVYQGFVATSGKYSILSFANDVPFITGDEVIYSGNDDPIVGLVFGRTYYVEVIRDTNPVRTNRIRLFNARSFIGTDQRVEFHKTSFNVNTTHSFTLSEHYGKNLKAKTSLVKIPLVPNIESGIDTPTKPGTVGVMINGVEIQNYKSDDRVYYGPLDNIKVLNGGTDYDVLNPPQVAISNPSVSTGTTAKAQTVVRGSVKEIIVDPQNFSINRVLSTTLEGGNGKGAVLESVVSKQFREIDFNASRVGVAATGGIDITNDTLTFEERHNLIDGQKIVYSSNGNPTLGIGSFDGSNLNQNENLVNGGIYYPQIINTRSVYLYRSLDDFNAGINTVGFTTVNTGGIHKFRTYDQQNVVSEIKVLNPGSGYENRKLRVEPTGISTITNVIKFNNHGFNDGDLINYTFQTSAVSGLSSSTQYRILKLNDSEFQVAEAVGGARTDFNRKNYVSFGSTSGEGYQIFSYPPIVVNVNAEYAPGSSGAASTIVATPLVRGEIVDVYVYDEGTDYGSNILNFHRNPTTTVKTGLGAQLKPIIKRGKIIAVEVQNGGKFYDAAPDLEVVGDGVGAKLRAVVSNGRLTNVIIINSGTGYLEINTSVKAKPPGRNVVLESNVRYLNVNNLERFSDELLVSYDDDLSYGVVGYSTDRDGVSFVDATSEEDHSKVIGWANDGNPIYGPYGFSNPDDSSSATRRLQVGYTKSENNIKNRPSLDTFNLGYFVEDYKFDDSGDLDIHNGRYTKTPEFPNGVYAYFVGVSTNASTGKLDPEFPYFIGDTYRSKVATLTLDQNFDFNKSSLVRNTFPYRTAKKYSGSDFLFESNAPINQITKIESVSKGSIDGFVIVNPGEDYKVGNSLIYNNDNTEGGGAESEVSRIKGKEINSIVTEYLEYDSSIVVREDSENLRVHTSSIHELFDGDTIQISGLSTHVNNLTGAHSIGITSVFSRLSDTVIQNTGVTTDIYVTEIPSIVSSGSSIGIGTETLRVLNVFNENNILRVRRGLVGLSHTFSDIVEFKNDSFTIPIKTDSLDSKKNTKVYFNPFESFGVGIQTGVEVPLNYHLGTEPKTISVPSQSIFVPNHPFKNNQAIELRIPSGFNALPVRTNVNDTSFNVPENGINQTFYVINKGKDFIGLTTEVGLTTSTNGLFLVSTDVNTHNSFEYYFETQFNEITADVQKIKTKVSISTVHGLSSGDIIDLTVKPNISVGMGTDDPISIRYDSSYNKILINPVGFSSSQVNISNDSIQINSHGLKTGEKIFYSSTDDNASGLTTSGYFVLRIDDNNFKLSQTYNDTVSDPPIVVSIASTGGASQEISLLNPQIKVSKNNDIVFNVSDTSLDEYQFKFFYDKGLNNEFVSTGTTSTFSVVETILTSGISTSYKITYNDDLPTKLYYSFQKDGVTIDPDTDVVDHSEIVYIDSDYNGSYKIFGIGATTFHISPNSVPERLDYTKSQTDVLEYTTNSLSASGPISKINIVSPGFNYSRLPFIAGFSTGTSTNVGSNAIIRPTTTSIGKINNFRIVNEGFEYASDKTLRPEANISKLLTLTGTDQIDSVTILDGGRFYLSPPQLVVVNMYNREIVDPSTYSLNAEFVGNTIVSVEVVSQPKGLQSVQHNIFAVNNSNGIQVERITGYSNGVVTLELSTPPIDGFSTPPFAVGDKIFVEGLQKESQTDSLGNVTSSGSGFNSADNGYNYFTVTEFTNSNPAVLSYDIGEFTDDAGVRKIIQTGFTAVIKKDNLPSFKLNTSSGRFFLGEKLAVKNSEVDLTTTVVEKNLVKIDGDYDIKINDVIEGVISGIKGTVESITSYSGRFSVDYSSKKRYGWKDDIGKLNDSLQVLPNNDYFQNLSYTLKSTKEFNTIQENVSRHVHPTGMKNFADMQIESVANIGIGISDSFISPTLDFIAERRVDTINAFDLVQDYEATNNSSRFLIFKNKRLADFIECRTNRVLQIDDISNRFSSAESNRDPFIETIEYPITDFYSKFLIQVTDELKQSTQVSEVVVLNDYNNTYTLNKVDLFTDEKLGDFNADFAASGDPTLRFDPVNPNDFSYNLKVYRESFTPANVGSGFTDVGFVRIDARTNALGPANGGGLVGFTTDVFEALSNQFDTTYTFAQVLNTDTNEMNYFEVVGHYDGSNTHISEYYYDTANLQSFSGQNIGTFGLNVSGGVIRLTFENDVNSNLVVKTKTVGIGTTAAGIGTYRYLVAGQIPGTERTAKFDSQFKITSGISTVFEFDSVVQFSQKSIIKVGVGETVSVHNLMVVADQTRSNIQQSPFVNVGTNNGIGTFSSEMDGTNVIVKFHPDAEFASDSITIQSYNQHIYADVDEFNIPSDFNIGTLDEGITNAFYGSINVFGRDKTDFDLNYKRIPIFEKTFNPASTNTLNRSTGVFTINDHFFETGEELIYTPTSTLIGVTAAAVGIGTTITSGTIVTGDIVEVGFSTITGIGASTGLSIGSLVFGDGVPTNTTITGIQTFNSYFSGDVIGAGSSVITGIANTSILTVGAGIFSGDNTSLGTIFAIGINSITADQVIVGGDDRTYFADNSNWSVTLSNVSTASTTREVFTTGISTDIMPERVYAIRLTKDTFKLTGTAGGSGIGFTFTDIGSGNLHKLEMKKKLSKSLITIDGVTQYPLAYTPLSFDLENNGGTTIGAAVSFLSLSGISSIRPRDILKIDEEFLEIQNVGLGTTNTGPITGVGTFPVINVSRGFVGTAATEHQDGSEARIYKGAFNIVGNKIHFTQAPDGKGNNDRVDASALSLPKSTFNGRVYLRRDYTGNKVYDDISLSFNGIGRTFSVYNEGENTLGLEAGSNLVFINDIFQTPDTANNTGNNYSFSADENTGISSVTFTGITRSGSSDIIISEEDVNQNQIPRGGVVISVASTGGLGYAPLVNAKVKPTIGAGKSISGLLGVSTFSSSQINISTSRYIESTGILEITTATPHNLYGSGTFVYLNDLEFSCAAPHAGVTTTIFPDGTQGFQYPVTGISSAKTFEVNVGTSTIPHTYESGGTVRQYFPQLTFGSGYRGSVGVAVTDLAYAHRFVSAETNSITDNNNATYTATNAKYTSHSGILILTIPNHGLTVSNTVGIDTGSLTFKCSSDNFKTNQVYPRSTDPVAGIQTTITAVTTNTITVNIGPAGGAGTGANITATVGAGGTLAFNIVDGGSGYINPVVSVDSPSYDNLSVTGVSRLGLGATTATGIGLSMTFDLSPSSVGIGTSYFEIDRFEITNPGYSFKKGDVFKPVGLVTAAGLSSPISEIKFTVTEVFNDSFSSWQLGEFDYIDSNASRQDGIRTRFPLFRNSQLLSFEKNSADVTSSLIDFDSVLLIYVNGVMQEPGVSYTFEGGTTFSFTEAPKASDKVDVFFYRGTRNSDSVEVNINETIKPGDEVRVYKNDALTNTVTQDSRIVADITSADTIETGIYLGDGINETDHKPLSWSKQKRDLLIGSIEQTKSRDSIEGMVFPTAKVIKDFDSSDTEIFLDDAQFFNYEENESTIDIGSVSGLLISGKPSPVGASVTAVVSTGGTITSIDVIDGGSGYTAGSTVAINIAPPIGGIGTVFKTQVADKVGTIGIGSTAISGINTSSISVGHFLDKVYQGSNLIIDETFNVIGITTLNGGEIELNKSVGNSIQLTRTFDFGLYQDQQKAIANTVVSAAGTIASITISNAGSGYTATAAPATLTRLPDVTDELITGIQFVSGYSGIVTGITTSVGIDGNSLALRLDLEFDQGTDIDTLEVGFPIMVSRTTVGNGVTSIDNGDSAVVGIGTTFADNIYYVHAFTRQNLTGIITTNILSSTNHVAIGTTSGSRSNPCGFFSWGRLAGFTRGTNSVSIGVSGFTANSGLTTYPTLQRRDFGLRDNGSLRKEL